jgi:hypothetical protein
MEDRKMTQFTYQKAIKGGLLKLDISSFPYSVLVTFNDIELGKYYFVSDLRGRLSIPDDYVLIPFYEKYKKPIFGFTTAEYDKITIAELDKIDEIAKKEIAKP